MILDINKINICIINLPERTQRLERTLLQLDNFYGRESYNHYLVEGVRSNISYFGIATAHMNCIQLAKDNNWDYVCIVEDDVYFQSNKSKQHADQCFLNVPDDFDILLGGVYASQQLIKYNEYWNETKEFAALHYYVVSNKCYDKILAFEKNQHIDRWLAKTKNENAHRFTSNGCGLKCYVADTFFAIQFDGYSDNVNQEMNYSHLLNKFKVLK